MFGSGPHLKPASHKTLEKTWGKLRVRRTLGKPLGLGRGRQGCRLAAPESGEEGYPVPIELCLTSHRQAPPNPPLRAVEAYKNEAWSCTGPKAVDKNSNDKAIPQVRALIGRDLRLPAQNTELREGVDGEGGMRREGTSEAALEAVRKAVGGGCHSGSEQLLSATNAIEAGTWCQGDSNWA